MSTFIPSTIICTCGEHYVAEVANGLHISARPDIRAQILAGTFHTFACPRCGRLTIVDKLLSFTDFPNRLWFTVAPSTGLPWRRRYLDIARQGFADTMTRNAPPLVIGWSGEMRQRLVFGLAALREQLVAFDAGLDDRVVELLKIQLVRDVGESFAGDDYFHLVSATPAELVFDKRHDDGVVRQARVPRALYDALAATPDLEQTIALAFPDGLLYDFRAILAPHAAD